MKKKVSKKTPKKKKKSFFRLRLPKGFDPVIHASVLLLMLLGFVMVISTSVGESSNDSLIVVKTFLKELLFIALSIFLMCKLACNFINKLHKDRDRFYKELMWAGMAIFAMLISCQLFPGANGSKAWIYIPIPGFRISLQPSEFAKGYLIVIFGMSANYYYQYYRFSRKKVSLKTYLHYPILFFLAFVVGIMLQPDFGTCVVLSLIMAVLFLIPSYPGLFKYQKWVKNTLIISFILIVFVAFTPVGLKMLTSIVGGYKVDRLTTAANPFINQYGSGYNMIYSLFAIANGGLRGLGLGGSEQKFGYLPEAETDFILSVTIEELGLFGFAIIFVLYGLIIYRLFKWALKCKYNEGYRMILIGTAVYLGIHFIFNVGGVSGFIPLTGVPLLFISSGGSSMLSISLMIGVCQSIIANIRNQNKNINSDYQKLKQV